jgi:hypothetical protein
MDTNRIRDLEAKRQAATDKLGPLTTGINGKKELVRVNGQPDQAATDAEIKRLTDLIGKIELEIETERRRP